MNERINDKVGISNTKLSFSEIAFNNKVNTLEPTTFSQSSSLSASKGKPSSFLINVHISNPRERRLLNKMFIRGGFTPRSNPLPLFFLEKVTPFISLPWTNGSPFTYLV